MQTISALGPAVETDRRVSYLKQSRLGWGKRFEFGARKMHTAFGVVAMALAFVESVRSGSL